MCSVAAGSIGAAWSSCRSHDGKGPPLVRGQWRVAVALSAAPDQPAVSGITPAAEHRGRLDGSAFDPRSIA